MKIVTAKQMQELDRKAIAGGIPGITLMERAGKGVFEAVLEHFPEAIERSAVVLCGKGNNGGDGFVFARLCHASGIPVRAFLIGTSDKVTGDARISLERYRESSGRFHEIQSEEDLTAAIPEIHRAGVIVDALLGTGLSVPVAGLYRKAVDVINAARASVVVSVDIPSGVDATSGDVLGEAVRADVTCTFALPKRGLIISPGSGRTGKLVVVDIGIPKELVDAVDVREYLLTEERFAAALPKRNFDAHKGVFGHVLVVAGSPGMTGAATLAGQAAMRSGAGLVTVAVPASLNAILEAKLTEVMTLPLPDDGSGLFEPHALGFLRENLAGKSVLVIGPGLSRHEKTCSAVRAILDGLEIPAVIDADGLYAIAADPACLQGVKAPVILTPHPGEMARLAGCTTAEVQRTRIECSRNFAQRWNVTVVLKGAFTVVADPGGDVFVNPTGNPGMASGGMGDALTGMIAGLISQGIAPHMAAQLAVFAHGRIGDTLAKERAPIGILAGDVIERIPKELQRYIG